MVKSTITTLLILLAALTSQAQRSIGGSGGTLTTPGSAAFTAILVTIDQQTISIGDTANVEAFKIDSNGNMYNVTNDSSIVWASSDGTKATIGGVADPRVVTAVGNGSTNISATLGILNISVTLNVTTLSSIAVTANPLTIGVSGTTQFTALGTYSDGSTSDVSTVDKLTGNTTTWNSGTPANATINSSGLSTGVAAGSTNITATSAAITSPAVVLNVVRPIFTPTSLPTATSGTPYSQQLTGSGGLAPYTFSCTAGCTGSTITSGVTLSSSGLISGTPSLIGTTAFTVTITDANSISSSTSTALSVISGSTLDINNTFCPPSEISNVSGTFDGVAQQITNCVNTSMANTPSLGTVLTVTAGSASDLQAKFNSMTCGQTVQIPALNGGVQAVYSGNYTISNKLCPPGQWITIITDLPSSLPSETTRMTPSWAGYDYPRSPESYHAYTNAPIHGVYIPKLVTANPQPLLTITNSSRIRFIGMEWTTKSGVAFTNVMVSNSGNDHIIFDRLWIHGGDSSTEHSTTVTKQGIVSNSSTNIAIVNTRLTDFFCISGGCVEAQAIAGGNGSGGGPLKQVNNYASAAGEPVFFGGGNATGVPNDIEIRRIHTYMPLHWFKNDASYDGVSRTCKNTFEMKTGNRILIEAAIFENSWGTCVDQNGFSATIGPKNQALTFSGQGTSDGAGNITATTGAFRSTLVSANCATPSHCHFKWNGEGGYPRRVQTFTDTTHINISPAPAAGSGSWTACDVGGGPTVKVADVTIRYTTFKSMRQGFFLSSVLSDCGDQSLGIANVEVHDSATDDFHGPFYTYPGGCCVFNVGFGIVNGQLGAGLMSNIEYRHNTILPYSLTGENQGNMYLVNFTNSVVIPQITIRDNIGMAGLHQNDGVSGLCPNATNTQAILNCESPNSWCFTGNVITSGTFGGNPATTFQGTLPTSSPASGACPGASVNYNATDYTAVGFTNLNGANGGNYSLSLSSPYRNAASDGKDPGADFTTLNSKQAGVK